MMEFDHAQEIRAAQVRVLHEQAPSALTATITNAVILVAVLWREVTHSFLIGWLIAGVLVSAVRYLEVRAFLRAEASEASPRWRHQYLYGVALNGVLWGFASFFFFASSSYVHQVFLAFVLVGMVSGGVATLSPLRGAYLVFLIPALFPYAVRLVSAGGELHFAMAGMLVIYVAMMAMIAHRLNATVAESLRLRFDKVDLLRDLTQAKERLQTAYAELERRVEERTEKLAQSEQALRDADRRKDEFLAMLGHELRNPLAPIRNALQIMNKPGTPDSDVQWARQLIDRQVDHLTRLVDDLLDVSRIVRGKVSLHETVLDISKVVEQAVEANRPFIEARRHQLSVSTPQNTLWVRGDSVRLSQAISNLLNNAAKYTDNGGYIHLSVEASENWITVRVRDNGVGIPANLLPSIFDLFTQADQSLGRTQGGLGIGLTLTKRLIEMHGGRVEARSEGLGCGSEFTVQLPRHVAATEPEMHVPSGPAQWETPLRVLVVDDNEDAADTLACLMRLEGHTVEVAFDGATALSVAAQFQPKVVLLDIGMPGLDGYQVVRELRARETTKSAIIVALTGYGQPSDRKRAEAAGFDDHLTKPIDPSVLMALLKAHLAQRV
jgi:signal transduction histidine kinase/ActR/RegA family two-component response regulator